MSRKQPLSRWLSNYQPVPGPAFEQKMKNAPWKRTEEKMTSSLSHRTFRLWQIAAALVVALLILSLSIPAVRASLSAWLGLSVAPSNQMPAVSVTIVAVSTPSPTRTVSATALPAMTQAAAASPNTGAAETATTYPISESQQPPEITQLSSKAGWTILAPTHLPEGYHFQSAYFNTNQKMVMLTYTVSRPLPGSTDPSLTETKSITVLQAQKNDFIPMQIAPATNVTDVQIGGQHAVYAVGAWDSEFVKDDKEPNGGKMVSTWRNDLPMQNFYWQVGDIYLVLISDDAALSQQDMIGMAASFSRP